jgi:hypothetical protein
MLNKTQTWRCQIGEGTGEIPEQDLNITRVNRIVHPCFVNAFKSASTISSMSREKSTSGFHSNLLQEGWRRHITALLHRRTTWDQKSHSRGNRDQMAQRRPGKIPDGMTNPEAMT